MNDTAPSSALAISSNARASVGASLTGLIVRRKISLTLSVPSFAVTSISIKPLKLAGDMPVKLRVVASKLNQVGSGLPLANLAVSVRASPSTSVKLSAGKVRSIA